jgi:biotin synthase
MSEMDLNFLMDAIVSSLFAGIGIGEFEAETIAALRWQELMQLLPITNRLREEKFGNSVRLCGILNARSGRCAEDCKFCSQSGHWKTAAENYGLVPAEKIVDAAKTALQNGAREFSIVTSGKGLAKESDLDTIAAAVKEVRLLGLEACASLGILCREDLARLQAAGLLRYHHNLETSQKFFPSICTTHAWDESLKTASAAKQLGLKICCGGIFGLGETWADRADLAVSLSRLSPDSVPINFLIPIPGTPLENQPRLTPLDALKIIVIFRLTLPDRDIIVCGGREEILGDFQSWIFAAGATGFILGDYLTCKGRSPAQDLAMISALGLAPVAAKS